MQKATNSALDHDVIVIGSGFGGSVSALRLSEKGYNVLLLEQGSELRAEDFPETNWNLRRWLWAPWLGFRGLFRMQPFRHVMVLAGAGVGGGSLVYANTLPIPKQSFFRDPAWAHLAEWEQELAPHYQTARHMLGAKPSGFLLPADRLLQEVAESSGKGASFEQPHVGIYFGKPGVSVPDPYFDGQGPDRVGCELCGSCMTGCRHGAKNTLDKNYLYLARKRGLQLLADCEVVHVAPLHNGAGYRVRARYGRTIFWRKRLEFTCRQVIFSAGALGTNKLLLKLQADPEGLPRLSPVLGRKVRTNSEALIFVTVPGTRDDHARGIAINSLLQTDEHSHLEMVRYGAGSGFFRLTALPHTGARVPPILRLPNMVGAMLRHPIRTLRAMAVSDWARRTMILLYMRTADGTLRFKRGLFGLKTSVDDGVAPEAQIPEASDLARRIAERSDGVVMAGFPETLFNIPITAHILGGCPMGRDANEGVIDAQHRVFGYEGLYVIDGAAMSANPGVNPSLTITALAERAMGLFPEKSTTEPPR